MWINEVFLDIGRNTNWELECSSISHIELTILRPEQVLLPSKKFPIPLLALVLIRKSRHSPIFDFWEKLEKHPVDTGRKLNVHKTFRRPPGRLLNVLCTFNLRPVSTGQYFDLSHQGRMWILTWYRSVLLKRCSFQMFLLEPLFQQRCRPKPCNFIKKETLA